MMAHYRSIRLVVSGLNLMVPVKQKSIVKRFARNPQEALSYYARKRLDPDSSLALECAMKRWEATGQVGLAADYLKIDLHEVARINKATNQSEKEALRNKFRSRVHRLEFSPLM
ncbi:MAG: hypothetical protein N3E51_01145 [Candidatus Micrarchaeota archaeon]|nr:hypothetical protein [Candidatus Micrarchaeota archaeon]